MDLLVFCGLIFLGACLFCASNDVCDALRAGRKISLMLPDCCDGDKEDMLWKAWELMADADGESREWGKKFAAWEQEYFGCDGDCDE